jgi:SWIM zinc finger
VHSSMIGKVEKAMRYAHEPDRVKIDQLQARFTGDNGSHAVSLDADTWRCDCHLFQSAGGCAHTLAVQKMLDPMLSDAQRATPLYGHVDPIEEREEVGASA